MATARTMWERISELIALAPSSHRCEVGSEADEIAKPDATPEKDDRNAATVVSNVASDHPDIAPKAPARAGDIEKVIGEDAHYIRAWFVASRGPGRPVNLAPGISEIKTEKRILTAVAAAVKTGECVHAAVASVNTFDIRMAFPHVPEAVARAVGRGRTWKQMTAKRKDADKSDWERFAELNELCKARSHYTVERKAPNGTYRLREQRHEDEIGQAARQWWQSGHWPGEQPKLQVHTNAAPPTQDAQAPADAAVYYGMVLWPIDVPEWRSKDDPVVPTKDDVDNAYWFVEELHRELLALGMGHRTVARKVRQWAKYIGHLQRPAAAASIMHDMAQGIDRVAMNPESDIALKNRVPLRETKFAAEG